MTLPTVSRRPTYLSLPWTVCETTTMIIDIDLDYPQVLSCAVAAHDRLFDLERKSTSERVEEVEQGPV